MSLGNSEIKTYFGRCRCCLNYGYLKNMWEEHSWQGEKEVYVEMLIQCFALTWEHSDESMDHDQICETCITRLRDADSFKKTILQSQETLLDHVDEASVQTDIVDRPAKPELPVKIERLDYSVEEYSESEARATTSNYIDDPDDPDYVDPDDPDYVDPDDNNDHNNSNEMDYEEVEYLEIEDNKEALAGQQKMQTKDTEERRNKKPSVIEPTRKWPKKLPKSERYKTYKQYTEEDLRKCLEAVRKEELTPQEASEIYNIPKKTICSKVKVDPNDQQSETLDEKTVNKEKMYQMIQEVKTILTYTNATPYKSKANRYYCAYCSTEGPFFKEADELRTHTRTEHVNDRTHKIEYALRPHWMNETLKLDIDNLLCNVCCTPLSTWNDMFKHLKVQHKIILDQAYTRVIPYVLTNDLHCALCKEGFTNYMQLDGHMNAHYNNYVCEDCGDTYLAANRLKQHKKIHDIGKYPCGLCSKMFSLEKYRKKHEELVHKHATKFKCWYCDDRFSGEYLRHLHILEKHKEKVKNITCEVCGKTFTWRPYYVTHMRRKHMEDPKKFSCQECDKKFFQPFELKEHMLRHTGEKHFPCKLCNKRFISSGSLKHHYYWHKKKDGVQFINVID